MTEWDLKCSNSGAQAHDVITKRNLGEYGSYPYFPRALAPEYSMERGRAYLLSSGWVQELPRRSGRHIRFEGPESNRNLTFDAVYIAASPSLWCTFFCFATQISPEFSGALQSC